MLFDGVFELSQQTNSHRLHELQIGSQGTFHACEAENGAVRNISHQQLNHKQKLCSRLREAGCAWT
jgi:hypothetical protein